MSDWNGSALQTEYAQLLGDTSTAFKVKVSRWLREVERDICAKFDWPFLRAKGQRTLVAESEEQNIYMEAPSTAATAAISAGGSLTEASTYSVKVTYYESTTGIESTANTASATVTATAVNKTISLTAIPLNTDNPLVTGRKLYVSTDSGDYYYSASIADNTTTTATITSEPSSKIEPPENIYLRRVDGELFLESSQQLESKPIVQLRALFSGSFGTGTPLFQAPISHTRYLFEPSPSTALDLSYYYFKVPRGIYPSTDSIPDIPIWLKDVLTYGMDWKGAQYRDRAGKFELKRLYEDELVNAISKMGSPQHVSGRVRDVVGDSDGFEL